MINIATQGMTVIDSNEFLTLEDLEALLNEENYLDDDWDFEADDDWIDGDDEERDDDDWDFDAYDDDDWDIDMEDDEA